MTARHPVDPARLKELRKSAGLTRSQVAAALDISERTVYRHESGVTPLRRLYVLSLADLYGVPVEAFYGAEEAVA